MSEPRSVRVELTRDAYDVRVGSGSLGELGAYVAAATPSVVAVVTDDRVAELYAPAVEDLLSPVADPVTRIVVPAGETSKDWETAGRVLEEMAASGLDRRSLVVALGGGVVGDLAGFCAATYMRGIPFVQVPTTLLAQVDSSVGGKTAVDLAAGKNLAGAFWQPRAVFADTDVLATLPDEFWADGLAEVVKTAFLVGEPLLSWLEGHVEGIRRRDSAAVTHLVESCVSFKASVVVSDERESGPREQLNLGHTLAHAIERLEGYSGVAHGAAVAVGLRFAALLAERETDVEPGWRERQARLIDAFGLPLSVGAYAAGDLIEAMRADKKSRGGVVRFVFSTGPGRFVAAPVADSSLAEALRMWESTT